MGAAFFCGDRKTQRNIACNIISMNRFLRNVVDNYILSIKSLT